MILSPGCTVGTISAGSVIFSVQNPSRPTKMGSQYQHVLHTPRHLTCKSSFQEPHMYCLTMCAARMALLGLSLCRSLRLLSPIACKAPAAGSRTCLKSRLNKARRIVLARLTLDEPSPKTEMCPTRLSKFSSYRQHHAEDRQYAVHMIHEPDVS